MGPPHGRLFGRLMGRSTSQNAAAFDRGIASLTVLSLLCVYLLPSQSGASFSTYLLAVLVVLWWKRSLA